VLVVYLKFIAAVGVLGYYSLLSSEALTSIESSIWAGDLSTFLTGFD